MGSSGGRWDGEPEAASTVGSGTEQVGYSSVM